MLFKSVATALFAGAAFASPVKRQETGESGDPVAQACSGVDQSQLGPESDLTCPAIQGLQNLLTFQGDNVSGQSAAVLNEVLVLLGDENPVSRIAQDVTTGIVSSLVNGVSNQLYSVAGSIGGLNQECRCNAAQCFTSINNAAGAASANTPTTQSACAQTKFNCARFYTDDEINDMIPGCAAFNGTTQDNTAE